MPAGPPGEPMTAAEIGQHLEGLLEANGWQPVALPLVHNAQAILLRIGEGKAHCRRESGSNGSVDLRLLAARREQLRTDSTYRPLQSDLREDSERITALIGPLLLRFQASASRTTGTSSSRSRRCTTTARHGAKRCVHGHIDPVRRTGAPGTRKQKS